MKQLSFDDYDPNRKTFEHNIEDPLDCEYIELDYPAEWQSANKSVSARREISRRGKARALGMKQPLWRKIDFAMRVIERAMAKEDVSWAVSFSAGNDSTVLSHLVVKRMGLKTPHVMSNTRLEYPQTYRNAKTWKAWLAEHDVVLHTALPELKPDEIWAKHGLPLFSKELAGKYEQWFRTGNENHLRTVPDHIRPAFDRLKAAGIELTGKCCDELKKKPMRVLAKQLGLSGYLTGSRAQESNARKMGYLQRGALYHSSRNRMWIGNPLVHWSKDDIHQYQTDNGIELEQIPTTTGRSGCVNCAFGCHIDQAAGRLNSLQILYEQNPKMHERTMENHRYQEACDLAGIDTK
jgi:3'-phosphoadenosine 5'-phosphosulfate sulfotransferase (PAPS reductase)/FAD synthetase